jgi:MFS family permease
MVPPSMIERLRPAPGTYGYAGAIVAAQMMAQVGGFALPALLPTYMARWNLTATEAGWLVGVFFAAYVVMVPILLSLTDRVPARRIYLLGTGLTTLSHLGFAWFADGFWSAMCFRILAGAGWAGTYMTGLRIISDPLEGTAQSRAVSWHAAGVGVSNAASFALAGAVAALAGADAAFLMGGAASAAAFAIALFIVREAPRTAEKPSRRLLDYRPVFQNRPWHGAPAWLPDPTMLFTLAGLAGVLVSISGNESAQRWGRSRVVLLAMSAGAALSLVAGWTAAVSTSLAVIVIVLWNAAIYLDSSALTAGTVGAADKEHRGATMGMHSMCGYAGGFVGPPLAGLILDLVGRDTVAGWGFAFGHLALITLSGLAVVRYFNQAAAPRVVIEAA